MSVRFPNFLTSGTSFLIYSGIQTELKNILYAWCGSEFQSSSFKIVAPYNCLFPEIGITCAIGSPYMLPSTVTTRHGLWWLTYTRGVWKWVLSCRQNVFGNLNNKANVGFRSFTCSSKSYLEVKHLVVSLIRISYIHYNSACVHHPCKPEMFKLRTRTLCIAH